MKKSGEYDILMSLCILISLDLVLGPCDPRMDVASLYCCYGLLYADLDLCAKIKHHFPDGACAIRAMVRKRFCITLNVLY